jgi:hypothetical protein
MGQCAGQHTPTQRCWLQLHVSGLCLTTLSKDLLEIMLSVYAACGPDIVLLVEVSTRRYEIRA